MLPKRRKATGHFSHSYIAMQNDNQELTKKERRQLRREEKALGVAQGQKTKARKGMGIWVVVILVIALAGFGIYKYLFTGPVDGNLAADPLKSCVNHAGGMHIHPDLSISIDGVAQEIPANIGVSVACMRPLHTHDSTGKIHVEFPREHDFRLRDFFTLWGESFNKEGYSVTMTVNGEASAEYENLILRDGDQIKLDYTTINK